MFGKVGFEADFWKVRLRNLVPLGWLIFAKSSSDILALLSWPMFVD